MIVNTYPEYFFNRFFNGLYPRVAKFNYLASISKNKVVVLFVKIRFFIMSLILPELMTSHQTTFEQKLNCVVQCSPAHTIVLILHFDIQRFDIKMLVVFINFLQNSVSLGCFSMPFFFQIFGENIFYNFLIFIYFHNNEL